MGEQPSIIGGRYELNEVVGRGGMGDVFVAKDTQSGDTVAVKLLKPEVLEDDPTLLERFEREGQALRQLNHPNIVKMLTSLQEDNQHYIIMEYVAGGSLQQLLQKEGKMPLERMLEITLDLADALTRAHRLKIIHRDIKPPNVLLAEDGTPKLTDFGVAHLGERTAMTATGSLIGTYNYLSPEAVNGDKLDERADIWSFGVMIYEMLAGQRPFEEPKVPATLLAIMMQPAPELSQFRDDLPPALVHLIDAMLAKNPANRVESVRVVGAELESILRGVREGTNPGSSSRFSTPTPTEGARQRASTEIYSSDSGLSGYLADIASDSQASAASPGRPARWRLITIGVLAAIVAVAGLWFSLSGGDDGDSILLVEPVAPDEMMVLVANLEPLGIGERDVSRFIASNLEQTLVNNNSFSKIRIREYDAVISSEAEAQAAAEANSATLIIWGDYADDFVEVAVQLGTIEGFQLVHFDRQLLEDTINVRVRLLSERDQAIAPQVLSSIATLQNAAGDGFEVSRTFAILEGMNVSSGEILGDGVAAHAQRFFTNYIDQPEQARESINAAINVDRGNPLIYASEATVKMRLGELDSALRDVETAERLAPDEWTTPLYIRANIALAKGDNETATEIYDTLIELRPDDWFPYNFRGALHYLAGDYESAHADYDRALELGPTADFPYTFSIMLALRDGHIAEAFDHINTLVTEFPDTTLSARMMRALGTESVVFGPVFPAVGSLILGQYEAALDDIEAAIAIEGEFAELHMMRGLAYCSLGDFEAAEAAYTTAIELDPEFALLYVLRANALFEVGEVAAALEDVATAQSYSLGEEFNALLDAGVAGEVTCQNFFDYQP